MKMINPSRLADPGFAAVVFVPQTGHVVSRRQVSGVISGNRSNDNADKQVCEGRRTSRAGGTGQGRRAGGARLEADSNTRIFSLVADVAAACA
jgi:hypothetical protein